MRTLVLLHLVRVLKDGEWHDEEEVYEQLIPVVPTGIAKRWARQSQQSYYTRKGLEPQPQRIFRVGHDPIRSGARRFVRKAVFYQKCVERKEGKMRLVYTPRPARFYDEPKPVTFRGALRG